MGILNGTRINFWGGIQTNVCVANNTSSPGGKDILDLVNAQIAGDMTDEELIAWMRTPALAKEDPNDPAKPAKLYYAEGGWNYYGDHLVSYKNALVSSEGPAGNMSTTGSLAGQPVFLLGSLDPKTGQGPFFGPVMVDIDPTSGQTTQIYVGGLLIGTMDDQKLLIRHDTVCHSHSLAQRILEGEPDAPGSSVVNGTFQLTFPLDSIVYYDSSCASLEAIVKDPQATGIVLRFSMFEMAPYMTTDELLADYKANNNSSNPSSGRVIGTIGPAYDGEPQTCPPGRLLVNVTNESDAIGFAEVGKNFLSLDTVSLMLKQKFREERKNITGPIGPNIKFDRLQVTAGGNSVGSYDPLSETYYLYGGIIDVPISVTQRQTLLSNPIQITGSQPVPGSSTPSTVTINETVLRVYSNDRNIYLNDIADAPERTCMVRYLGGPLPADTTFTITSSSPGELPDPEFLRFTGSVTVPEGATSMTYKVTDNGGTTAGFETLTIESGDSSYFVNFRKYPESDFGIPAGATVTWEQVYRNALRFFYVVFPAMSKRIPLNFEDAIKGTGAQILARTSDEYRNTTLYMPIVRSMTPSQVKLLDAYLNGTPWNT